MSIDPEEPAQDTRYQVISVEQADAPDGMAGTNWHRYVIGRGTSRIEGLRTGTRQSVTDHAEDYVEVLNDRSLRGFSSYAPRNRKK
jgi:hypothetical protein